MKSLILLTSFTLVLFQTVVSAGPLSCQMFVTFDNRFDSVIKVKSMSGNLNGYEIFSTMSIQANTRRKTNRKRRLLAQVATYNKAMKQGETRQIIVNFKIYNPQARNWIDLTSKQYTRTCKNKKNMFFPLSQDNLQNSSKQALQNAGMWN